MVVVVEQAIVGALLGQSNVEIGHALAETILHRVATIVVTIVALEFAQTKIGYFDAKPRIDQTIVRIESSMVDVFTVVQISHARNDVVDDGTLEEPVQMERRIGQKVEQ